MAETKNKVVTVEALAILHEESKSTYMPMSNPVGSGTMTMNGDANISGDANIGSLTIGSKIKLVPTGNSLNIVFINES